MSVKDWYVLVNNQNCIRFIYTKQLNIVIMKTQNKTSGLTIKQIKEIVKSKGINWNTFVKLSWNTKKRILNDYQR